MAMRRVTVVMPVVIVLVTIMILRVGMIRVGMMMVVLVDGGARKLLLAAREDDVHLGGADPAPDDRPDQDADVGKSQSSRNPLEPLGGHSRGHQCAQEHVAADPRGGVENSETTIRHRLINMADRQPEGKPSGRRYSQPAPVLNSTTRSSGWSTPRSCRMGTEASAAPPSGEKSIPSSRAPRRAASSKT